jgi:hypothetical protein
MVKPLTVEATSSLRLLGLVFLDLALGTALVWTSVTEWGPGWLWIVMLFSVVGLTATIVAKSASL